MVEGTRGAGTVALLLLLLCASAGSLAAQDDDIELDLESAIELLDIQTLTVPEVTGEGVVDGLLDEPWWAEAPAVEIKLETYPALLEPAPVMTVARVARRGNSLWVSFDAADPNPAEIQAPFRTRDGIDLDDYVALEIDTTGAGIRSYVFKVSAGGFRGDEIRNRMSGARIRDWDANWEAAAVTGEAGWVVEMRIPLGEMQIPTGPGIKRTMVFKRHYPRQIRHHLTGIAVVIPNPEATEPESRWLVAPVVTGQSERERDVEAETAFETEDQSALGVDFEYRPDPAFRLLGTINPNYLEVETDLNRASVNDPFTPLQPERRRFFLVDKESFDTLNNLVYTRNIEEPRAGLKFGRQTEKLTQGAFLVDDRRLRLIVPGNLGSESEELPNDSYSAALRNRWNLKRDLALGIIATGRADQDDYHNVVAGFDLYWKFALRHELRFQLLGSDTRYPPEITDELCEEDGGCTDPESDPGVPGESNFNEAVLRSNPEQDYRDAAGLLTYKYNRRGGFFSARYLDVGDDFRGDLGFFRQVDHRLLSLSGGPNKYFSSADGRVNRLRLSANYVRRETQAGELLMDSREVWVNYWGLLQAWVRVGYRHRDRVAKRFLQNTLEVEGNAPRFTEDQLELRIETSPLRSVRFTLATRWGEEIDTQNYRLGDVFAIEPYVRWNIGNRLELNVSYDYKTLDVEGGRLFREGYFRLSMVRQLWKRSFVRLTLVDDSIHRDPELYLYSDEGKLEQEDTAELVLGWIPLRRHRIYIGIDALLIDNDNLTGSKLEATTFFFKYSRRFHL